MEKTKIQVKSVHLLGLFKEHSLYAEGKGKAKKEDGRKNDLGGDLKSRGHWKKSETGPHL